MKKIEKAVILAAGFGSRFLPFTKSVPKAMLPLIDTPVIEMVVDEMVKSGIKKILIIVGFGKEIIVNHFSHSKILEKQYENKPIFLENVKKQTRAKIIFEEQQILNGTGGAIMLAKKFTQNEPFVLAFADDLMVGKVPVAKQLIDESQRTKKMVLGCQNVSLDDIVKYSSVEFSQKDGRSHVVSRVVEKPKRENVKSTLSTLGRYVFFPSIYDYCEKLKPSLNGELVITDCYDEIAKKEGLIAFEFDAARYDMGNKFGYLTAVVDSALENEEYAEKLKQHLKSKI